MTETISNLWASKLIEDVPVGIVLFDMNGRVSWANQTILDMLGADNHEEFIASQDDDSVAWHEMFSQPETFHITREDGVDVYLECKYQDYNGSHQGRAGFYTDAGEKHRLSERVERLTMNDPLTSMLNWRGIMRELDTLVSRSRRYENALSVMHVRTGTAEDSAVQAASRCLREQTRWTDLVGRYSDDSFLVVLPETAETDASVLIEKIKKEMSSLHEQAGLETPLNVAIVAVQWQRGEDTRLLLERLESQHDAMNAA